MSSMYNAVELVLEIHPLPQLSYFYSVLYKIFLLHYLKRRYGLLNGSRWNSTAIGNLMPVYLCNAVQHRWN